MTTIVAPPVPVDAFSSVVVLPSTSTTKIRRRRRRNDDTATSTTEIILRSSSSSSTNHNKDDDDLMRSTSRLSHAMVKVPSVDDAVSYWKSIGGRVKRSRKIGNDSKGKDNEDKDEQLLSAFITIGHVGIGSSSSSSSSSSNSNDEDDENSFDLEIVKRGGSSFSPSTVGIKEGSAIPASSHGISYLGLSMLLKFQNSNPLLELIKKEKITQQSSTKADDDNDDTTNIVSNNDENKVQQEEKTVALPPIKYVASAPGDGLARIALLSNNKLVETRNFYTTVLGMDQKAQDTNFLCLRYDTDANNDDDRDDISNTSNGVSTTLVFVNSRCQQSGNGDDEDNDVENRSSSDKNCVFDHLAIQTTSSIEKVYQNIIVKNENINSSSMNSHENEEIVAAAAKEVAVKVYMKPTFMFGSNLLGVIDPNGYKVVIFSSNK